jgi:hypothetical protein
MPDEPNEPLPDWLAKALTAIPWEEVKVPHLPLRLMPGLAERDARIAELEAEADRLRGLYHDESIELRILLAAAVALLRESYKSDAAVAWLREYDAKTQPAG